MKNLLLTSSLLLSGFVALPASAQPDIASILAPITHPQTAAPEQKNNTTILSEEELTAALAHELKAHLGLEGDLRVFLNQSWHAVRVPAGQPWKIQILQTPAAGLESNSFVRFRLDSEGQRIGEWQLPIRAQLLREVWSTVTPIDRGQAVSANQLKKISVDLLRERQAVVPTDADLTSYTAATAITADRLLTWRDLSQREVVRRGQVVEVVASEGGMNITMKGVAMSSGGIGDEIVIRNMDSRRDISARIVSPGTARVTF